MSAGHGIRDDPYVYPGTSVLRNRFGVRDGAELARREAAASAVRLAELAEQPLPGPYDLAHLQAFHRRILGDVFEWAGELRTTIITGPGLCVLPGSIATTLGAVLRDLPAEGHLRGYGRGPFVGRLTHYLVALERVRPFRHGNGRVQRAFLGQLAREAGYWIDWSRLGVARNDAVARMARSGHEQRLHDMLNELVVERRSVAGVEPRPVFPRDQTPPRGLS